MSDLSENRKDIAIASIQGRIESLEKKLGSVRNEILAWTDANANLSRSAAVARAENQGIGNGIMGALLGSKFRSVMRSGAVTSNAAIAKEVASKRTLIADGKRDAQNTARILQSELKELKQELRACITQSKSNATSKSVAAKKQVSAIDLLHKLKEAHIAGLLTDAEFEEKRKNLVAKI